MTVRQVLKVTKTCSTKKLVVHAIVCKKQGDKGLMIRENAIVLYLAHEQHNILQMG